MTPILEGLDGVQKMSKSLNNAIGINEPPAEMYGKLMSINDELMWKYWVFLTDLRQCEVDALRAGSRPGTCIRWKSRSSLARTITAGFHGEAAAAHADENWARMFQQKEAAEDLEEVAVAYTDVAGPDGTHQIRLPKLLVQIGLAASGAEANRKIAEKAVKLDGEVAEAIADSGGDSARPHRSPPRQARQGRGDLVGSTPSASMSGSVHKQNRLRQRNGNHNRGQHQPVKHHIRGHGSHASSRVEFSFHRPAATSQPAQR